MPSIEEMTRIENNKTVPLAIQDIKVFLLYVCPICDCYTIHKPRLSADGNWYVDHTRVSVFQMNFDGVDEFVGLAPSETCFVDDNLAISAIEPTRTVIRVK